MWDIVHKKRETKKENACKKGYLKVLKWQPAWCFVSKSGSWFDYKPLDVQKGEQPHSQEVCG